MNQNRKAFGQRIGYEPDWYAMFTAHRRHFGGLYSWKTETPPEGWRYYDDELIRELDELWENFNREKRPEVDRLWCEQQEQTGYAKVYTDRVRHEAFNEQ
jgi:hypothetical protein